jgi:hypothetical protein
MHSRTRRPNVALWSLWAGCADLLAAHKDVTVVEDAKGPRLPRAQQVSTPSILEFASGSPRTFRSTEDADPLVAASTNPCPFVADATNALALLALAIDA